MKPEDRLNFIGLSKEEALLKAKNEGTAARVIAEDGVGGGFTTEWRPDRLNFWVEKGSVVAASWG